MIGYADISCRKKSFLEYILSSACRVLVIALLGVPVGTRAGVPLDSIVAIVNDDVVMETQLDRQIERAKMELRQHDTKVPPADVLRKQVLERLILMKIQLQLAEQTGLRVDDDTLNRAISNIAAENGLSLGKFRDVIENEGYRYSQFREDIRDEIVVSRLRQRQVDNLIHVTDREVDNYLATQKQQDKVDKEYHLAHILIGLPEGASPEGIEERRTKAAEVLERLRAGADFKEMAIAVSDGQQAREGGDLGWRRAAEVPTLFADALGSLQEGATSDLMRNPSGFHIVKLLGTRNAGAHVVKQTRARHILIQTNELVSGDNARTRLTQLKQRIEGGEDFGELARSHSSDKGTAAKGGDLGWVSPGSLAPKFEEVMNSLSPGGISDPFETDYGWHIVQVRDRRDHDDSQELIRTQAREAIRQHRLEQEHQAWLRRLRDEAFVEYRIDGE